MQLGPKATVIISTYNQPKWLELVLHSYNLQTIKDFEIVIADDGSTDNTKQVIDDFKISSQLKVTHVWQEDDGFQKTKILNKAIVASNSDYIIFTDGDCIARNDFIETHLRLRKENSALSGGYYKLTETISNIIDKDIITAQKCFDKTWLIKNRQPKSFKMNKLSKSSFKTNLLNKITTTKATFDGMNVSCWKTDILAVNGFDERMKYGGEDREVGERMMNNGIKFKQIRYSAICVHLHHERPYKQEEAEFFNRQLRTATKRNNTVWSTFGIKKDD
ncbi:MAG: glycosyltransferase family 2 protein [Winogradskyella sp.]|uniref:glycosyltransferase family 2 protein n=1 Tax=Winogradskyella sp. TaxID=1883156 RepID=UPI0025D48771|nr:glycosyltransferase family 2 protein [Winogradskyella sp.]NRB58546.1 glycosyltransferase family 2 protein [Winogradskyella sp.]